MIVSERIFMILKERRISQAEFASAMGIAPSVISDWKRKGTNPATDRILPICQYLNVSPTYLLDTSETTSVPPFHGDYTDSENDLIEVYRKLNTKSQTRLLGYMDALLELQDKPDTTK